MTDSQTFSTRQMTHEDIKNTNLSHRMSLRKKVFLKQELYNRLIIGKGVGLHLYKGKCCPLSGAMDNCTAQFL